MSISAIRTKLLLGVVFNAALLASVASAQISTSPSTLSYKTELYATSLAKYVFVTNTGTAAVSFGAASIDGADAGDFATIGDTCSNHTIAPLKKCKVGVDFSATLSIGSTETASLSIVDNLGNTLATIPLSGLVIRGSVRPVVSGLTITLINPTKNQYGMDFSLSGPYGIDQTNTTCTDVVLAQSKCNIVLVRTGAPAPGALHIVMAAIGPGGSYKFTVPVD